VDHRNLFERHVTSPAPVYRSRTGLHTTPRRATRAAGCGPATAAAGGGAGGGAGSDPVGPGRPRITRRSAWVRRSGPRGRGTVGCGHARWRRRSGV